MMHLWAENMGIDVLLGSVWDCECAKREARESLADRVGIRDGDERRDVLTDSSEPGPG